MYYMTAFIIAFQFSQIILRIMWSLLLDTWQLYSNKLYFIRTNVLHCMSLIDFSLEKRNRYLACDIIWRVFRNGIFASCAILLRIPRIEAFGWLHTDTSKTRNSWCPFQSCFFDTFISPGDLTNLSWRSILLRSSLSELRNRI